jgi:hypothetical protein
VAEDEGNQQAVDEKKDEGEGEDYQQRWDEAHDKVKELEDEPPKDLKEWPDDEAKYVTFGGGEGDHGYDEGPEQNLGPSSVRRHEDGSVEVDGEEVDNPDDYKMESIKGDSDHPADD